MLNQGWQLPLSPYRVIRAREFAQLIERMRINVPSSIRESERTIAERDRIIAEAHAEADRIIQQAKQQAMEMLSERAVMVTAKQEAQRIVEESKGVARRRAQEADTYAIQVLQELGSHLQSVLQQVENGIQVMSDNTGADVEFSEAKPRTGTPRSKSGIKKRG